MVHQWMLVHSGYLCVVCPGMCSCVWCLTVCVDCAGICSCVVSCCMCRHVSVCVVLCVSVCLLVCMCGCECVEHVHICAHACCLCLARVFVDVCFLVAY